MSKESTAKLAKHVFLYDMLGAAGQPINPRPLEVEAYDMSHALQRVAAQLSKHTARVVVWKRKRYDDRSGT